MAKAGKQERRRDNGPYLDAALICEDLVQEKDFAVSPIRAVNRITVSGIDPSPGDLIQLPLILFLSFKAGSAIGEHELSVYVTGPSQRRSRLPGLQKPATLAFEGGDTGAVAAFPIYLRYEAAGTYWLDVVLGKKRLSRIPLTFLLGDKAS
jgi:hypothetical protein